MVKTDKKSPEITKTAHIRGLETTYVPNATWGGITKEIFTSEKRVNVQLLYDVVKHCPEAHACFLAQIEDIAADYWRFTALTPQGKDVKSNKTSSSTLDKAQKFETDSNYYHKFVDAAWDALVTGNGYILKLSVDKESVKSIMTNMTIYMARKMGVKNIKKGEVIQFIDQNWDETPRDLQVLKASTVKINFDKTGQILTYQQEVQGEKRIYQPEDIIHLKSNSIGGGPYGYSRLEPLLSDIGTLIFAKEFAGKYFENDGIPYFIFKMPDESPGGRNYKLLKKELRDLRKKGEKYRSMVLTGNVENEQVNKFNKDMEFAKLIEHFTINIFVGLGVPAHRVNYTPQQKSDVSAQSVGKVESGYYKRIAFLQKSWELILNKELWSLFSVKKTFKRSYKIDEMREAEIIRILTEVGAITIEEARERIGMDPTLPKGTMAKPIGSDKNIDMEKDKKREQGIDQEPKDKTDNKLKSIFKSVGETIEVPFSNFVLAVEQQVGLDNFTKGKVLYMETPTEYILFFSDGLWKYKTTIDKTKLDPTQLVSFIKISP